MTRAVQKAGERALFQPGLWERHGGYAESGIPALDTIADIVGGLTGAYAQIYMADQLLGPVLAAAGRIPQVAKAGQTAGKAISKLPTLAQKFAVRAPRAALKGTTVETMRQALYPDEYKPGAAGIARGALMWAGGSIGNTLVEAAMQKAGIVLHPALEAFVEEIGENVGSTIAVAPFVEDKQQLLMELGPDILAEGLYEAVGRLIAGGPVDYESARIRVEMKHDLQEYTANKNVNPEKADAAYKRFWKRINDVFSPVAEAAEAPKVPEGQMPEQQELGRTLESVPRPAEELPAMPSVFPESQVKATVYHGSSNDDIERFITDPEKLGTSTGARDARLGAFFSESPDIATTAAWSFDITNVFDETRKPTLYEAEINLRHPLDISKISKEELDELERFFPGIKDVVKNADDEYDVVEFIANKTGDPVDLRRMMNFHDYAVSKGITDENVIHTMWRERSGLVPEWKSYNDSLLNADFESKRAFPAQDILKRLGYDGIIVNTIQDSGDILGKAKQYIVFDLENIVIKRKYNLIGDEQRQDQPIPQAQMQADSDDLDLGWLEQRLDETHGVAGQDVQQLS
ncbi:hypothetical protein, partial [Candidatus Darwinibacter acetoxidans]